MKKFLSKKNLLFIYFLIIIFYFSFPLISYCSYPKLVTTLSSAFEKIETWLVSLATPAAAVAVATGVFMKKFSFGDEERMRIGKKLIRTALVSYGLILIIDLVLSTIQNLLTAQ